MDGAGAAGLRRVDGSPARKLHGISSENAPIGKLCGSLKSRFTEGYQASVNLPMIITVRDTILGGEEVHCTV